MSELRVTTLKHESATVDNITLDASGNLLINDTVNRSNSLVVNAPATVNPLYLNVQTGYNSGIQFAENNSLKWQLQSLASGSGFRFYDNVAGQERMRIDTAGRVAMPFQPAFHALRTSGAVAIDTVVLWNQVLLNRGNSYNASTGRFTAPITGAYLLHSHMNNTSGTGIHPELRINGASTNYYRGFGVGSTAHAGISAVVQMTAGDYAHVVTGTYGAIQGDPGYNNAFCGYLIG